MTRLVAISAVAFGLWLLPFPVEAQDISGDARVIDGMTLEVQGQRLRLFGIDAPDLKQTCRWPNKVIPCGQVSRTAMMDLVAQTRVVCAPLDQKRTGVRLARCRAGGFDIGANMVHTGWALAFRPESVAYVETENKAKKARRGLWKGDFTLPWEWRQNR